MIPDRRSSKRALYWAVSLVTALSVILSARPIAAASPEGEAAPPGASLAGAFPTRIEGQVKSISGSTWQVDENRVELTASTVIKDTKGGAQVGAWVLVAGDQYNDHLVAEIIQVVRSAGSAAPTYQFTGILIRKGSAAWQVDDTRVTPTTATQYVGDPAVNSLVRVTARWEGNELLASEIRVIAPNDTSVPVAIEGVVQEVTGTSWVVDEQAIKVTPDQAVGAVEGDTVEITAVAVDGSLVAQQAEVVDVSQEAALDGYVTSVAGLGEENQAWTVVLFDGGRPQTKTVHISPETYVDEDRAVIEPEVEAQVQGQKLGETSVDAALVRIEQPVAVTTAGALTAANPDGLWRVGNEPVWFGSDQLQQEALASAAAGTGTAPTQAATLSTPGVVVRGVKLSNGIIVAKEVLTGAAATDAMLIRVGVSNTAMTTSVTGPGWYGPNGITPSMSKAAKPTLLFDARGAGHAVFESDGKIYYAYQPSGGAWGTPVKIGTGFTPSADFDASGRLHVAYTNEFLGNYDILSVSLPAGGSWSLPKVVAPTTGKSADPVVAAAPDGSVYIAWADLTSGEWAIQLGTWDGRFWTSYPVRNARGQSAALDVLSDGALFMAWQDRIPLPDNAWGKYDVFASERIGVDWDLPRNVSDNRTFSPGSNSLGPRLTTTTDGLAHLAWIDDGAQVRYDLGRRSYWPAPVDASDGQTAARGLSVQTASDGMLYLAWDDGVSILVTAAPPGAQVWPTAQVVAALSASSGGSISDVSLAAASNGIAVSWAEDNASGSAGIYESRHNMTTTLLKNYLPLISH